MKSLLWVYCHKGRRGTCLPPPYSSHFGRELYISGGYLPLRLYFPKEGETFLILTMGRRNWDKWFSIFFCFRIQNLQDTHLFFSPISNFTRKFQSSQGLELWVDKFNSQVGRGNERDRESVAIGQVAFSNSTPSIRKQIVFPSSVLIILCTFQYLPKFLRLRGMLLIGPL